MTGISGEFGTRADAPFIASVGYTFDLTLPNIPQSDPVICDVCPPPPVNVPQTNSVSASAAAAAPSEDKTPEELAQQKSQIKPEETYIEIDAQNVFIVVIVLSSVLGCIALGTIVFCIGRFCLHFSDVDEEEFDEQDRTQAIPPVDDMMQRRTVKNRAGGHKEGGVYYPGDEDPYR